MFLIKQHLHDTIGYTFIVFPAPVTYQRRVIDRNTDRLTNLYFNNIGTTIDKIFFRVFFLFLRSMRLLICLSYMILLTLRAKSTYTSIHIQVFLYSTWSTWLDRLQNFARWQDPRTYILIFQSL